MKKIKLIITLLISYTLTACGSDISIVSKTSYSTVNSFSDASMEVTEVNADEETITVEISYTGKNKLSYGETFEIEVYQDNEWHSLDSKKFSHTDIGFIIESGKSKTETYRYTNYGKLPTGHYRIIKQVSNYITSGNYTEYILAAEFDIK